MTDKLSDMMHQLELVATLNTVPEELLTEELMEEVNALHKIDDRASFNAQCASHHGITVSELVASPNMGLLQTQFSEHLIRQMAELLVSRGFTEKQASALIEFGIRQHQP